MPSIPNCSFVTSVSPAVRVSPLPGPGAVARSCRQVGARLEAWPGRGYVLLACPSRPPLRNRRPGQHQMQQGFSVCRDQFTMAQASARSLPPSGNTLGYDSVTLNGPAPSQEEAPEGQARPTATPRHAAPRSHPVPSASSPRSSRSEIA